MNRVWNVLVIGGGHAGIEAAWAAAKFAPVALMLSNPSTIGRMPCNPAVGGPGKSQLVAEVTALGGLMGTLADETAIHTRMLNLGKGPAVHSLRVQDERDQYAERAQEYILGNPNIHVIRAEAADLMPVGEEWQVVATDGRTFAARSVVVAAGTFLRAQTWYGRHTREEGRQGESPSRHLSNPLAAAGHRLKRYKTGTPPRIRADSVNFSAILEIPADLQPHTFSGHVGPDAARSPTWQTHTTTGTHRLIRENLHESPMFAGDIAGLGPRYCPSIEDKVVRFAHHDRHLLFVEPDGVQTSEVYLQGFSSSLPPHLQDHLVRSLPGFDRSVIVRYAYAVEYDVVDSTELTLNLESRLMPGVFTAGQLNGTSGYEEAAAQGLVAGTAAARRGLAMDELFVSRETGYIGVLLDDLVFAGSDEPYRMMTSRVEHRLLLRQDNADLRLLDLGKELGVISGAQGAVTTEKYARIEGVRQRLSSRRIKDRTGEEWLRRPEVDRDVLASLGYDTSSLTREEWESLSVQTKYGGYIARAQRQIVSEFRARESSLQGLDFQLVSALSNEAREKLSRTRPHTLAQASRIPGVRHADITNLLIHLRHHGRVSR